VLGAELRTGSPTQLTRFAYQARHAERYRDARILLDTYQEKRYPIGARARSPAANDAEPNTMLPATMIRRPNKSAARPP
jgi:hypothetical protein